ncbi:MAG: hypothetical protein B7Z73_01585 [Planctomycetia bacterium 21-64-5]|nr:MAG: hypothetical protein B7Z73_01585 [Planctomycetia bacterium 21-64-5]
MIAFGLAAATVGALGANSPIARASGISFGSLVGHVGPCQATRFDAQPSEPLIIILTRSKKTFETYNVSADPGTTSYHFDVPEGRYELLTTWWGTGEYSVTVRAGMTTHVDFKVSCGPFST